MGYELGGTVVAVNVTPVTNFHTGNWEADAPWLSEPYRGADAYVTDGKLWPRWSARSTVKALSWLIIEKLPVVGRPT